MLSHSILPAAIAVNRPAAGGPVVVSIPHAGRIYPPEILAATRVDRTLLERLEDSWCDLIATEAAEAGATVVQAMWARAVADLNRGEGQMAPGEVAIPLRAQFSAPGRKERAGLGVVPTRLADCGPLWKRPIDHAALHWRLESFHRPYHAALAGELSAARDRFGHAILLDLHSMPPIPPGLSGHGARIVVGDHFGATAGEGVVDRVMALAEELGVAVSRNQPYAGGHIVRTHGKPGQAVHAIQIEIDRSLYLTPDRLPDPVSVARLVAWFSNLVQEVGANGPESEIFPQAAE
ncbi:N-formylglutamate amidohydrolase [Sphingopyxis sp. JAI128]|uniref:N-formylglutamate amidohydrolase n=1 Tax=Sphingopyxis sp. JAI128 TaxID=2723066 RepID=UPI00160DB3D0|nr:N-formylglutamate amidohydrolase [Sphingopyxis sp. JAI128]MBB6424610.1 N-formylglutamate amidohydrolase [Sphingopyxis sp. JAI128]